MASEYIIYCDESAARGPFYSNFYGGLIISASDQQRLIETLDHVKTSLNFFGEMKWSKVTHQYLSKYIAFIDALFDEIEKGNIRIRIMFTQNIHIAQNLSAEQKEKEFQILYYQFLRHAFGFQQASPEHWPMKLRIYLDRLPDTKARMEEFKNFLRGVPHTYDFRFHELLIGRDDVTEVDSKKHVLLQGLDIVLGAMQFRLNNLHLEKPPGQLRRAERTKAKEKLYKHIHQKICTVTKTNFNIGMSTSAYGAADRVWRDPYPHWIFIPKDKVTDTSSSKNKKKKGPPC